MPAIETMRQSIEKFGVRDGLIDIAYRTANRLTDLMVLRGIVLTMEDIDASRLALPEGYEGRFATMEDLKPFVGARYDLQEAFLAPAFAKGDSCYAMFKDGELAAYGWYSNQPTDINGALSFEFDPSYVYMYKGFTDPAHRGKRLHAIGMGRALQAYTERGFKGIVSYVEANNFNSLKSCYRLGYRDVGNIYIANFMGRPFIRPDAACRPYRLAVTPSRN